MQAVVFAFPQIRVYLFSFFCDCRTEMARQQSSPWNQFEREKRWFILFITFSLPSKEKALLLMDVEQKMLWLLFSGYRFIHRRGPSIWRQTGFASRLWIQMQVQRMLRARPQQKVEDTTKSRMLYSQLGRKLFCKKKKKIPSANSYSFLLLQNLWWQCIHKNVDWTTRSCLTGLTLRIFLERKHGLGRVSRHWNDL